MGMHAGCRGLQGRERYKGLSVQFALKLTGWATLPVAEEGFSLAQRHFERCLYLRCACGKVGRAVRLLTGASRARRQC